ncbi:unnamed protein product [Closterium sp. NIES-54]
MATTLSAGRAAMPALHLHGSIASPPPRARTGLSAPNSFSPLIRPHSFLSAEQPRAFRRSGLIGSRSNARRCVQASSGNDGSPSDTPNTSINLHSTASNASESHTRSVNAAGGKAGNDAKASANVAGSNAFSSFAASAVACLASVLLATTAITGVSPGGAVAPALAEEPAAASSAFGGAFSARLDNLLPFLTGGGLNGAFDDADASNGAYAEELSALGTVGELARVAEFAPVGGSALAEEYIRPGHRPDLPMSSRLFGPARQADEPQQVHISLAGPGAMRVTWVTMDGAAPAVVQYGDAPGRYTHTVTGTTTSYSFLFYRSGFIHTAVIGGPEQPLAPNTVYYYRVGTTDTTADVAQPAAEPADVAAVGASSAAFPATLSFVSNAAGSGSSGSGSGGVEQAGLISSGRGIVGSGFMERSFKTLPADPSDSINIAIVGDMGQTGWTVSTLDHIAQQPHDLLVLPGDLSYADAYQPRWDTWQNLIEPLASTRPWMVIPGNHEIESLPGLVRPFTAYNARWTMPAAESASPSNLFYSFESAGVHWVMLNSYSDFEPDSIQGQWLKNDLAGVDRSRTPWLVAVVHAPWYNSNTAHQLEAEPMRRALERVLYDARTDMVFAGHVHAYERTERVFDWQVDPCGPIYITIGDGGNKEGLATRYLSPSPEWSIFQEASFGHGELKIFGKQKQASAGSGAAGGAYGEAEWVWHRNDDDESMVVATSETMEEDHGKLRSSSFRRRREAMRVFHAIDANGDGMISQKELSEVLEKLGNRNSKLAKTMIQSADQNGDDMIDFEEFLHAARFNHHGSCLSSPSHASDTSEEDTSAACDLEEEEEEIDLVKAFSVFDRDGNGTIGAEELQQAIRDLSGETLSVEDCKRMIARVDSNGDGLVDFGEFTRMMEGVFG